MIGEATMRGLYDEDEEDILRGSTVFAFEAEDVWNEANRIKNEKAMMKTKDITANFKSKREMFKQLNYEDEELELSVQLDHKEDKSRNFPGAQHLQLPSLIG